MGKIPSLWNYLNNRLANLISTSLIRPHQLPQLCRRHGGWQAGCVLWWRMTASVAMCFTVLPCFSSIHFWHSGGQRFIVTIGVSGTKRGSRSWPDQALMWTNTSAGKSNSSGSWHNPSLLLLATSCALWVLPSNNLVGSAEFANILKWLIDCILIA